MKLYCVTKGNKKAIEEVNDVVFSQKMMGDGIAVMSSDGCVYAPAAGEITMLFPTHHAIGMKTDIGIEVLIHIGIDTVEMDGKGFQAYVEQGCFVKQGQLLIQFDLAKVVSAGYEPDVMVIITNTSQYHRITKTTLYDLTINDVLLEVE